MQTRHTKEGYREVLCPACNQWVLISGRQDDTRWRFSTHPTAPMLRDVCLSSGELVAPGPDEPGTSQSSWET